MRFFHKQFRSILLLYSFVLVRLLSPKLCLARDAPYELSLRQDLSLDEDELFEASTHDAIQPSDSISTRRQQHLRHEYESTKSNLKKERNLSKLLKGQLGHAAHPFVTSQFDVNEVTSQFMFFDTVRHSEDNSIMNDTSRQASLRRLNRKQNDDDVGGWIPSAFPDPVKNPEMCHIPYSFRFDDAKNKSTILFCDPDEALNDEDREFIGRALVEFSLFHDQEGPGCDLENNYNLGVSEGWKEYRMTGTAFADLRGGGGKVSSLGGSFISNREEDIETINRRVEIGIAIAKKVDVDAILRKFQFYSFEDADSMTDDAAQFFASILHNQWFNDKNDTGESSKSVDCDKEGQGVNGILIFLSIEDRVCFISSGDNISSILPWWRLERVVTGMRENLKRRNYSEAIIGAIQEISEMLNKPPTVTEKLKDFLSRFGLVFLFSISTFALAVYGEIRERQRRYEFAEINTRLTDVEEEKARMLQQMYKTDCCPICLEDFVRDDRVSDGIPSYGSDGRPVKMLRCGHIFCATCWRTWIQRYVAELLDL